MKYLANYLSGKKEVKTASEAEQLAIAWQQWQSENSISWGESSEYLYYFEALGKRFNLTDVFHENGII